MNACVICEVPTPQMFCPRCAVNVASLRTQAKLSTPPGYNAAAFGAEALDEIPNGLITGAGLHALVGYKVIDGLKSLSQVNAASIDITLGYKLLHETVGVDVRTLRARTPLTMREVRLDDSRPFVMKPGEFVLAHSNEIFNLPDNISALYTLKSSMARIGLDHLNAGWCDAGWNNSALTLELKNVTRLHDIGLFYGDLIGQMIFFKHPTVPADMSYAKRGRYNGDQTVSGVKP